MIVLIDTERLPQHPIDKAASSILTDRCIPYARGSWQQCTCCDEWNEDSDIEYTFTCTLGTLPSGAPTPTFQLKTRYPAYTCPGCAGGLHKQAGVPAGDSSDGEGEAEQLCPLHVQAVYVLQGSHTADNIGRITKGFHTHCPDCQYVSRLLKTPAEVRNYIWQHLQFSKGCIKLKQALAAGTYDNPAAFGPSSSSSSSSSNKVQPEKVILELMSRLVVMTACHIVSATRPPPTPIDKLSGEARRIAAVTAHIRSSSKGEFTPEGQQLLPYRVWAVDALTLDSELLSEANWLRPSLAGLALEHKPSLLDLVLAPPYIAVAEHDAGMTVDKLAVLLLRQQQQQKNRNLHRLATAGADQLPAAVAAVEAALSDMLIADPVLQYVPVQQRVQQFLDLSGIPGLGDVVCALAQPHVAGRGPQNRHLAVCAVCGTPAALQRAKQSHALHRCKYCIVSTCQSCRQEQQEQQRGTVTAAAPSDELCLWCQGHPDTQDLDAGTLSGTSGSRDKQQQQNCNLSSMEHSVDQAASAAAAAAAVLWDVKCTSDRSLGTQQQQAAGMTASAPAGAQDYSDAGATYRSPRDYDIVIELAAAAAAETKDRHHSQSEVAANSQLQQEIEDLQQMQAELQSAVESLGIQGLQLPAAPATPLRLLDSSRSKHKLSPLSPDIYMLPSKRQKAAEPTDQPERILAAQQADSTTADSALTDLLLTSAGFTPLCTAAVSVDKCEAHTPASLEQACEAAHMLADAGFTPIGLMQSLVGKEARQIGEKEAEAAAAQQHQQKSSQAAGLFVTPVRDCLKSLDQEMDVLCADISDWCSSNLVADHADGNKTLQVIRELKRQLWDNYQQTGQQLFINGLKVLGEIVGAFTALPAAGAKVVLACNCQRWVPGTCCPDNQPGSVLELVVSCWLKEMQDSGATGVKADCKDAATAAGGSPKRSSDLSKQQQAMASGQCQSVLRLIAQLSSLQYQVYYGPLAAGAELQQIEVHKDVAVALRDAVIHVMSGTALLMLQGPEAGLPCSAANSSSSSKLQGALASQWQRCLFKCKWAVANRFFYSNDASSTAMPLAEAARDMERIVSELLALKKSGLP